MATWPTPLSPPETELGRVGDMEGRQLRDLQEKAPDFTMPSGPPVGDMLRINFGGQRLGIASRFHGW